MGWIFAPKTILGSSLVYLVIVKVLHSFMKNRDPVSCATAMRVYNIAQVVVCGYMTQGLVSELWKVGGWTQIVPGVLVPNAFGWNAPILQSHAHFIYVHYLSKFLDWFDTFFIVLRKKDAQLSFLHVYHHATIGPIWGLLLYVGFGGGTCMFGALLNSFVHVLMYTHYFVTSFGIKNPFKKQLTMTQITQFYLCIFHAASAIVVEHVFPLALAVLQVCYHISMIILFSQFFWKMFKAKPAEKVKADSDLAPAPRKGSKTMSSPTGGTRQRLKAAL